MKVLVLGGYGVFGGRLSQMLIQDGHEVFVAGRNPVKAQDFCDKYGGSPCPLNLDAGAELSAALDSIRPDIVVDAAGPFQIYGATPYRVAEAALAKGAHYLDFSDDAAFTQGIAALGSTARANGCVALAGVSSVPALSSAVVTALVEQMDDIGLIETTILPGNRAPRGASVMAAILSQTGAPLAVWRGGTWQTVPGWSGNRRITLAPGLSRPAALIGAPDLTLFPARFGARSVLFRAGLELPLLHHGLTVLAWGRREGLCPPLASFARPLRWLADRVRHFGSDRGGMQVTVSGRTADGAPVARQWTLIAEAGDGPFIPAVPATILIAALARNAVVSGARAAVSEFDLSVAEVALQRLQVRTTRRDAPAPRLFEAALGRAWSSLPPEIRAMHDVWDLQDSHGTAQVIRGRNPLSRFIGALFGFPPAAAAIPVTVTMQSKGPSECWTRRFGTTRFASTLSPAGPGVLCERFGPFKFRLDLTADAGGITMTVASGTCLGLPLPRALLPVSDARETVRAGRFHFDVRVALPLVGLLVHYKGSLTPARATA